MAGFDYGFGGDMYDAYNTNAYGMEYAPVIGQGSQQSPYSAYDDEEERRRRAQQEQYTQPDEAMPESREQAGQSSTQPVPTNRFQQGTQSTFAEMQESGQARPAPPPPAAVPFSFEAFTSGGQRMPQLTMFNPPSAPAAGAPAPTVGLLPGGGIQTVPAINPADNGRTWTTVETPEANPATYRGNTPPANAPNGSRYEDANGTTWTKRLGTWVIEGAAPTGYNALMPTALRGQSATGVPPGFSAGQFGPSGLDFFLTQYGTPESAQQWSDLAAMSGMSVDQLRQNIANGGRRYVSQQAMRDDQERARWEQANGPIPYDHVYVPGGASGTGTIRRRTYDEMVAAGYQPYGGRALWEQQGQRGTGGGGSGGGRFGTGVVAPGDPADAFGYNTGAVPTRPTGGTGGTGAAGGQGMGGGSAGGGTRGMGGPAVGPGGGPQMPAYQAPTPFRTSNPPFSADLGDYLRQQLNRQQTQVTLPGAWTGGDLASRLRSLGQFEMPTLGDAPSTQGLRDQASSLLSGLTPISAPGAYSGAGLANRARTLQGDLENITLPERRSTADLEAALRRLGTDGSLPEVPKLDDNAGLMKQAQALGQGTGIPQFTPANLDDDAFRPTFQSRTFEPERPVESEAQRLSREAVLNALRNPSGMDDATFKAMADRMAQDVDDQYAQRDVALREEMAQRGLADSSIQGGRLADLNIAKRDARTELATQLNIQRARELAQARAQAVGMAQAMQGQDFAESQGRAQLALARQQAALNEDMAKAGLGLQAATTRANLGMQNQRLGLDTQAQQFGQQLAGLQLQNQLGQQNFANRLNAGQFQAALQGQRFNQGLAGIQFQNQLGQQDFANQMDASRLRADLQNQRFGQGMQGLAFENQLGQQGFQNQLDSSRFQADQQNQRFAQGMQGLQFQNQLGQQDYTNQLERSRLEAALRGQQFSQGLQGIQLENQMGQQGYENQMGNAALQRALYNDQYNLTNGYLDRLIGLGQDAFQNDLRVAEFNRAMANDSYNQYLNALRLGMGG